MVRPPDLAELSAEVSQNRAVLGKRALAVGHDVNNLLTVILGHAQLLQSSLSQTDLEAHTSVEMIMAAATRAVGMTGQLLTFARTDVPDIRIVDLAALVEGLAPTIYALVGDRVELSVRSSGAVRILANPGEIEQVVLNLAVNARDAMPNGGLLTIETTCLETRAVLSPLGRARERTNAMLEVRDTGVGMDPATLARIFEPYFTTKASGSGRGLGLVIVDEIVRASGGVVDVSSIVGGGTSVGVTFPSVDPAKA